METEHREALLPMVLAGTGTAILSEAWRALAREAGFAVDDLVSDEVLEVSLVDRRVDLTPAARAFLLTTVPGANSRATVLS